MKSRFLLDIVVGQSTPIFQLFTSKDETLLIWWNPFFVLDFRFYIIDGIGGLYFQSNGFAGERLYKYLHTTPETEDKMKSRLLLNIVIGKSSAYTKVSSLISMKAIRCILN